jgi:hypothetical protein
MKCFAAGGLLIAGELWVPNARKIFLPVTPKIITLNFEVKAYRLDADAELHEAEDFFAGMQWTHGEQRILVRAT